MKRALAMCALFVVACNHGSPPDLAVPASYRAWPVFLSAVQRPDIGEVRDIYINEVGAGATEGEAFPEGTVLVMDLFQAEQDAAGNFLKDDQGNLVKGALANVFLMGKEAGWGAYAPPDMGNGDWLYFPYEADGTTHVAGPTDACFSCHLPIGASQDWVQRYAEYFKDRK